MCILSNTSSIHIFIFVHLLLPGWTVLMRAADYGETDFVKLLLEHGADINAKNDHG